MELYTIGHSNLSAGDFMGLVQGAGIELIIDVRSKPQSRWPHFSRDNFIRMIRPEGIDYLWGGRVLGGLNEIKPDAELFNQKMDKIIEHMAKGTKVALMCSEGNPCECHRAGKLTAWMAVNHPEITCSHIVKGGEVLSNAQVLPKVKDFLKWQELSY